MQLKVSLHENNKADGIYDIETRGCLLAELSWAKESGSLADYSPFAYVPLFFYENGRFVFEGGRSIPPEAEGVSVRAVKKIKEIKDLSGGEEVYFPIPELHKGDSYPENAAANLRIGLISDLHMTDKPGRIHAALKRMKDMDVVLMAGDLVNNSDPEQYQRLTEGIKEIIPEKAVFSVAGNHDIPDGEVQNYRSFEQWLHHKEEGRFSYTDSGAGAFAVMLNGQVDLIGLNPLYGQKIFRFPDKGAQLKWLERYLSESPARQHIIMCHAPLLAHNPQRAAGKKAPYLAQDTQLQRIVDQTGNIIFLSGHTHLSPNTLTGCVEYDPERQNLYINDGSVCPTDVKSLEIFRPLEWSGGCYTELVLYEDCIEVVMKFLHSGIRISRGYYKIPVKL